MGKIKDFLCNWCWGILVIFVLSAALSIGLQGLLIWIGGLFPSVEGLGMTIDALFGFILIFPLLAGAGFTDHTGNGSILLSLLAIIGIYVCVVLYFNWFVFIGCLVLLGLNLRRLVNIGGDSLWIYGIAGAYLLYCIGAFFAMLLNNIVPVVDSYALIVLVLVTLGMWSIPAFD